MIYIGSPALRHCLNTDFNNVATILTDDSYILKQNKTFIDMLQHTFSNLSKLTDQNVLEIRIFSGTRLFDYSHKLMTLV